MLGSKDSTFAEGKSPGTNYTALPDGLTCSHRVRKDRDPYPPHPSIPPPVEPVSATLPPALSISNLPNLFPLFLVPTVIRSPPLLLPLQNTAKGAAYAAPFALLL